MTKRNTSEPPKDTTKSLPERKESRAEGMSLADLPAQTLMPNSEIVKLARSRPKPYQPRISEKTSPKKTSTSRNWADEYGLSLVEAMTKIDWKNPPQVKPEKPLFPPRKKKTNNEIKNGIDPEMLSLGVELAVFHIEAGARSFVKYAKAVIDDLGVKAKPFLKSWYMGARYYPGMNTEGMDTVEIVEAIDVDDLFP